MKHLVNLILATLLFAACNTASEPTEVEVPKQMQPSIGSSAIPNDNPVISMGLEPTKYTWKDLDNYYRNTLLTQEQNAAYFKNAKNVAFSTLVQIFRIQETAPADVVGFYVEEQSKMPYTPFVAEYILCLEKMSPTWGREKVKQYARKRYNDTRAYYENNTVWKEKWDAKKEKYMPLLSFANMD